MLGSREVSFFFLSKELLKIASLINKGNDWRVFAKRIGINESEIRDWIALKLQYPMARVLSFWSSRPDATVRLLHRHLNAPCFSYATLAKRIENFYDVI